MLYKKVVDSLKNLNDDSLKQALNYIVYLNILQNIQDKDPKIECHQAVDSLLSFEGTLPDDYSENSRLSSYFNDKYGI